MTESRQYVFAFEDKRLVRALRPQLLLRRGIVLRLYANGTQALERAADATPRICFAPLDLPDMQGKDLARRLKELQGDVPVVAVLDDAQFSRNPRIPSEFDANLILPADERTVGTLLGRVMGLKLRDAERFPIRVRVFSDEYMGVTTDLSSTGLFVRATKALPVDTEVEIKFALPGSAERIQVNARVVRVDEGTYRPEYGLALQFNPLSFPRRKEIDAYIASLTAGRTFQWRFSSQDGLAVLELSGRLTAPGDLLELSDHLQGPVALDLSRLTRILGPCEEVWKSWLRGMDRGAGVTVLSVSHDLALEMQGKPDLFEHCRVQQIWLPHVCEDCGLEMPKPVPADKDVPPASTCPQCNGKLVADEDIPHLAPSLIARS